MNEKEKRKDEMIKESVDLTRKAGHKISLKAARELLANWFRVSGGRGGKKSSRTLSTREAKDMNKKKKAKAS